jgi:tetratricopeptide (TPR) repeat protein
MTTSSNEPGEDSAGKIQADEIKATNVANVQYIQTQQITAHGEQPQKRPSLQRPRRAEHFVDRGAEQARLLAELHPGRVVTVCGPGGMGKTALVAEVLWTLAPGEQPPAAFPDGLLFYSFYGQPAVTIALEQLARTLGEDPLPTPALAAQRALSGRRLLLVLDGAEEADHLEQVLVVCGASAVLVTSRRRSDAADPALLLDLQRLSPDDAVAVMQAWQAQRPADEAIIKRICQLVGGLPLALRLVGSYLALHQEEAEEYLAWLEDDPFDALDQGSSSRKSVPVLLERSVARLRPDAQAVLGMIGLLALAPFERDLVAGVMELAPRAASRALGELVDYGMLVQVGMAYEVSHPLIHTYASQVLLAQDESAAHRARLERLVRVLDEQFPQVEYASWTRCEELLPHVQACAALLEQHQLVFEEAGSLLTRAGWYLRERGQYLQAALLLQQALTLCEHALGSEHSYLGVILNNLALLYQAQGQYARAIPYAQRAVDFDEQTRGPDHSETAKSLDNLAQLYRAQGRYAEAEPLYQRALAILEKALPPDHPSLVIGLENYAALLRQLQRTDEASALERRVQAIRAKRLS